MLWETAAFRVLPRFPFLQYDTGAVHAPFKLDSIPFYQINLNGITVKSQCAISIFVNMLIEVTDMTCAERIKALREDRDLNQTEISRAIHVAQTTYSDYEKGKVRIPLECLIALAKFYDVDLNYIAGISDTKRKFPKK